MRFLIFLLVVLASAGAAPAPETPEEVTADFYTVYKAAAMDGLPNKAILARIAAYLSPALQSEMKKAAQRQANCRKAHPDEKPPWIEGDMFSSNFEGFTRFTAGRANASSGKQIVAVDFEYTDGKDTVRWKDEAVLIRSGNRW